MVQLIFFLLTNLIQYTRFNRKPNVNQHSLANTTAIFIGQNYKHLTKLHIPLKSPTKIYQLNHLICIIPQLAMPPMTVISTDRKSNSTSLHYEKIRRRKRGLRTIWQKYRETINNLTNLHRTV